MSVKANSYKLPECHYELLDKLCYSDQFRAPNKNKSESRSLSRLGWPKEAGAEQKSYSAVEVSRGSDGGHSCFSQMWGFRSNDVDAETTLT